MSVPRLEDKYISIFWEMLQIISAVPKADPGQI